MPPRYSPRRKRYLSADGAFVEALRHLHAEGWTDREMAEGREHHCTGEVTPGLPGVGWNTARAKYWRRRLGLPANGGRGAKNANRLVELRRLKRRINAGHWGLRYLAQDDYFQPEELKILNALAEDRRPMTREQLAAAIKIPWGPRALQTGQSNALGKLLGRGLVVRVGPVGPTSGRRGPRPGAFALRPDVQRLAHRSAGGRE